MSTSVIARVGVPSFAIFIVLVAAAALFGIQFQPGFWYENLNRPAWNPPNAVFGPVWTVLYIAIAVAGWRLWRRSGRMVLPMTFWIAQLVLNAWWSLLFFGLHRPDIALVDIVLLLVAILAFILTARRFSTLASWLFVPYALWVGFATALNFAIWRMNSAPI